MRDGLEGLAYIFFLGITAWFMYLMVTAQPAPMMAGEPDISFSNLK